MFCTRHLKDMGINTTNKTYISDYDLEEIKKFYVEEKVSIKEIADLQIDLKYYIIMHIAGDIYENRLC